jgi:hypothetical protein
LNHGDEVHRLRVHANVSHDARDIEEIVDDARRRLRVALDKRGAPELDGTWLAGFSTVE